MFNINEISDLYSLFTQGLIVGGLLSAMFFVVGFAINSIIIWLKKA